MLEKTERNFSKTDTRIVKENLTFYLVLELSSSPAGNKFNNLMKD